jgi:hypothetical protein
MTIFNYFMKIIMLMMMNLAHNNPEAIKPIKRVQIQIT